MTISIGVSTITIEKASAQGVLASADKALYRAKANRVETVAAQSRGMRGKAAGMA